MRDDVWEFLLSLPVIFYSCQIFFVGAWHALRARTLDMMVLVAVAIGTGWAYSVAATFFIGIVKVIADVLPGDKAGVVTTLQERGDDVLLFVGPVTLWRARRTAGRRRRRYLRCILIVVAAPFLAWAMVWFLVFPIGFAYIYTHTGKGKVTPNLGIPYESVSVPTSDSLELAASYVPSQNRAAVVLFPGATHPEQARMLLRHGYGVLLLDPRGQGESEGDTVRWAGDRDLLAAVTYLRGRPDVDPDRIGGFGFSVGGEMLLEAAAQSNGFKAIFPKAPAAASATKTSRARPDCSPSRTWPS